MHVAIVTQNDYPHRGEVRPRRLAQSLHQFGHRVFFISWNCERKKPIEDLGYAKVYRFNYFIKSKFYLLLSWPFPLNPFWVFWIWKIVRKESIDILIASNIRVALPTILAAKLLRKHSVLDLQENNAELVNLRPKSQLAHYITRNSHLVRILEHLCVKLSNHVWVVIEERLQGFLEKAYKKGKISVIHHTVPIEDLQLANGQSQKINKSFTLIYIGIDVACLEIILRSFPYVLKQDNSIRFLIGGMEVDHSELKTVIEELGIRNNVEVAGMIDPEEVPSWIRKGDIGVIPYKVNRFTNSTISNKIFHYMAAGLPVLSTDMVPTRRIIEEVKCGKIIPLGSTNQEIAEIILQLKNSLKERVAMGQRAIRAIREKYNWDVDFDHALSSLEKLIN
jgi:glycosyltransferase involved in cell wall biosynthesis